MLVGLISLFVFAGSSQGNLNRFSPGPTVDALGVRLALLGGPEIKLPEIIDRQKTREAPKHAALATNDQNIMRTETDPITQVKVSEIAPTKSNAFRWNGYGLGNYVNVTGLARPHNIFVLLFYEMGVLAAIPVFLLGWAVWNRKIPLSVFLALFLLWQVTEEAAGRVEGFFTTAAVLIAVWRTRPPANRLLAAIGQRLRLATPSIR